MGKKKAPDRVQTEKGSDWMEDITNECLKSLDKRVCSLPLGELPRVYIELDNGKWPKELGEEPTGYSDSDYENLIKFTLVLIERRIGMKAILRAKKEKEGYTPQMFDDWWHSEFSGRASINTILEQTEEIVRNYSFEQRRYERGNADVYRWAVTVISLILLSIAVILLLL